MKHVIETCKPRPELLAGNFNPEVFTLSLMPIIEFYRKGSSNIDPLYTDPRLFFPTATYPTQGLKVTLGEVFARLQGDMTVPAIHRLETAFGGGKTHTLIACTHIAFRGKEISDVVAALIRSDILPEPGSVCVAGVAGDLIPVHEPKGSALEPYTLWGEIAYQIGGEELYRAVESEARSYAAPGRTYFDKVFGGRKVLIMLDELAQYAARLEAARPDGADQLAAFLMALHSYARNRQGVSIVLTLASAHDAFARQTGYLARLISEVRGEEVGTDDALGIGERAVKGVASVVARDAVQVTPVHAGEISSVLAKRLFESVDREAALETAEAYMEMYRRNSSLLPDEATRESFKDRMAATYPFHPTLIDYLNNKLATAENFQGTRGVLRVLSLAVRDIWLKQRKVPMIHACHLDLRSDRVVNEILGRSGSSDLLFVLNADIGGVDTGSREGGMSNAEAADRENPHPEGYPLHEFTWKTVFLHSLVGREEGLASKIFGITEAEALFSVSFPGLTPAQVRIALEKIDSSAFYLKFKQGKYFADQEPTLESILASIRRTVTSGQIEDLLKDTAGRLVKDGGLFHVEQHVSQPEHVPDGKGKIILGVVSPVAQEIDIEAIITTKGFNKPREQQNLVMLLVPETTRVKGAIEQPSLCEGGRGSIEEARKRMEDIARQVKAWRTLMDKPQSYGVNPRRLQDDEVKKRWAERENALHTAVASAYTGFYYASAGGQIVRKEIKTAGGEGGAPFVEQILEILKSDKKLLTPESTKQDDLMSLSKLFFERSDIAEIDRLYDNFLCVRGWPVLQNASVLEQIIRAGVEKGIWCAYRMGDEESSRPSEFYSRDNPIPMGVSLANKGYGLVTPQGANKREWSAKIGVEATRLRDAVYEAVVQSGETTVEGLVEEVREELGDVSESEVQDALTYLVKKEKLYAYRSDPNAGGKPNIFAGEAAGLYVPRPSDGVITPARAGEKGWITKRDCLIIQGEEGSKVVLPLLKRIGSIYMRGAKSKIEVLDLSDVELPGGGTLRLEVMNVSPDSAKAIGELFEVLGEVVTRAAGAKAYLRLADPDDECLLVKEIKKAQNER